MATANEATKPRWERAVEAIFRGMWEWGVLYALIAVSLGLALWPLTNIEAMKYIVRNDLTVPQRSQALLAVAISVVVTTAGYLLVWLRGRRREPGLGLADSFRRTNYYAFILLALPLVTALGVQKIEVKFPIFTAFLTVTITALAMVFGYRVLRHLFAPDAEPFQPARRPRTALAFFIAAVLGYCGLVGYYAVIDHHNLGTAIYDLGIYDNAVWQTAHGYFLDCTFIKGGNHVSAHFDPIIGVVALIYRLYMHAETLLVLQTVWLASGAIPIYLLARRRLKNEWFGALLALVYLMSPGLHGINMFDFHSLALIVPNIMWAVYLLDTDGYKRYWLVIVALLLTREDISLICCFIGAYAILSGRTRTGLATIAVSMAYLYVAKVHVMASTDLLMASDNSSYSYAYYYADMIPHKKEGTRGLIMTAITNPIYTGSLVLKEDKLLYFIHLLLPLLCLPFAAGRKLILSVYGLLFIGLASRKHVFSLHFQYSALLLPMLFAAAPDGLGRVVDGPRMKLLGLERARLAWTLMFGMLVATTITSVKYGVIFPNSSFKAGWNRLTRIPTAEMREKYVRVKEIAELIGPDAAVSVTSAVGPHLSNRRKAYHWPTVNDADYLVLNSELKKDDERRLKRLRDKKQFRLIDDVAGIALYQRIEEDDPDAAPATAVKPKPRRKPATETTATDAPEAGGAPVGTPGSAVIGPALPPTTSTARPSTATSGAGAGSGPAGSAGSAASTRPATGAAPSSVPSTAPGKTPGKAAGSGASATGAGGTVPKGPAGAASP
ncbi:MAG TPA: DUF2079 domain-containing protein [Nannocystis sp.]|jgi:uncharacterized membrane protein